MAAVRLRNISEQALGVPVLGVTIEPDHVVEFAGRLVDDPVEVAVDLRLSEGQAPTWPDDARHAYVDRAGQILAFPTATWRLESTTANLKKED